MYQKACDVCNCKEDSFHQWHVDCSKRDLNVSMVPTVYPNLTISLILSRNRIGSLLKGLFSKLDRLEILDISYATLLRVDQEAFDGLYRLEELDLSHNLLLISNISVPVRLIRDLISLKIVKLDHNVKDTKRTDISYPDEALGQMKSLRTLFIDGLRNSTFGPGFRNLINLTAIFFSGYCELKIVSSEMFKNVPYVQSLILRECGIEYIHKQAFAHLAHLRLLDLSDNKKLGIEGAARCFRGLKNTSIRVLKLNNIYSNFKIGVRIRAEHIKMLRNTSITEIEFSRNKVEIIDGETFEVMPINLTKLNVSNNKFVMGDYLFRTCLLKNLTTLDASYQLFPSHTMNLNIRNIISLQNISRLFKFKWQNMTIQIPETMKIANFSHSKLAFPVVNFKVGKNRVEYLDASYCMLYSWKGPVIGLDSITYLDLSNNHCSELSFDFFYYLPRLVTLLVSNNLLGIVICKDKDGRIFQNLNALQHLDLSNNRISYLDNNIFRGLLSINTLNISNNLLDTFPVNIDHMKNLRVLDLSQNMLQVVQYPVRKALQHITSMKTEIVYVNISNNQLRCTCSTFNFMIWVRDTKTNVVGMTSCMLANGTKLVSNYTNDLLHYTESLNKECMSKIGLILGTTISIFLALVMAVVGIVYRYRWKLRYLYYMAMNKFKGYYPIGNFETDNDFVYDAFVSFADEDREFVREVMLKKLEHERGIRVCVSFRDFIPGREIASNIMEAIHNSRKTVMLLTENFLLSTWCLYEFQMAYQEAIHNGRDTVIVILYEDIPTERIYRVINFRDIFQSNSYIEYPHISRLDENEQALDMFWDRCTQAIKESGYCNK